MKFSDISNTSNSVGEDASVNLPQNTRRKNPIIYINYSLYPCYGFLYGKVKEMM